MSTLGHKNVGGLEVAVDHPLFVGSVKRIGYLNCQTEQHFDLDGLSGDAIFEVRAIQKFHDNEPLIVMLRNLMDGTNVGVVQAGSGACLTAEAFQSLWVPGDVVGERLEGQLSDRATYPRPCQPLPHATAAEFFQHAIVQDGLPAPRKRFSHTRW